jgi:hypothetical protein
MRAAGFRERLRKIGERMRRRGPTAAAEALLVALFLLAFLVLLKFLFPDGTGLRDLLRDGGASAPEEAGGRFWNRDGDGAAPATVPIAGRVAAIRNDVQSRRAESIAWERAENGMALYPRDAVQTSRDSGASIWIGGRGTVDMGEKSLMVVRRVEREAASGGKRSILLMVEGEIRGRVDGTKREPVALDLASMGGVGRIVSRGGRGGATDFRVTVNPDRTTTYSVFEGSALVQGMGSSVTVGANQYTIVSRTAPPTRPAALPAAPEIDGPGDGAEYVFRSLPPRVRFSWNAAEPADAFHVVLARDPEFREPVVSEWVPGTPAGEGSAAGEGSFVHGNLPEGTYYWRVTAKRGGVESGYPKARMVRLVRKTAPPALRAEAVPDPARGDWCLVRGTADRGASLRVAGREVPQDDKGAFESIVPLERGINLIVVEASDAAGNTAYVSLRATGK